MSRQIGLMRGRDRNEMPGLNRTMGYELEIFFVGLVL